MTEEPSDRKGCCFAILMGMDLLVALAGAAMLLGCLQTIYGHRPGREWGMLGLYVVAMMGAPVAALLLILTVLYTRKAKGVGRWERRVMLWAVGLACLFDVGVLAVPLYGSVVDEAGFKSRSELHRSGLWEAVESGEVNRARKILKASPGLIAERDYDRRDVLTMAILRGDRAMAAMLLAEGAIAAPAPCDADWPLHLAAKRGEIEIAGLLLDHGAYVNRADDENLTPLRWARRAGKDEMVSFLRTRGGGEVDLHQQMVEAVGGGRMDEVVSLQARGVSLGIAGREGESLLDVAAKTNRVEMAAFLIARGANVNRAREDGWTPLHWACLHGVHLDMIRLLVAHGANVNARLRDGSTPLHVAIRYEVSIEEEDDLKVVRVLLELGADPNAMDEDGQTPLDYPKHVPCPLIADLLRSKGGKTGMELKEEARAVRTSPGHNPESQPR